VVSESQEELCLFSAEISPKLSPCGSCRHIIDQKSAERLNPFLQDALFIMVVANSCANPLVYGVFHSTGGRRSSAPTNATASAYTMSTYTRRSTKTLCKSRASMQTEFVDSPPNGHCVTHLSTTSPFD